MPVWYCRWRRRAILVLACLLMAVAVAPLAGADGASSRALAALVLRASPAPRRATPVVSSVRAHVASARLREARPGVVAGELARVWRQPPASRGAVDARYLYLLHGKLLC